MFMLVIAMLAPAPAPAAQAGTTLLVSRPDGTGPVAPALDNDSETPAAVSADGRYVVFSSDADGLAPGADPHVSNLFLRDTSAGTTTLVSRSDGFDGVGADASSEDPAIAVSPAGHVDVAFSTEASNLSDHVTGAVGDPRATEVWLRDVTAGTTTLVTRQGAAGAPLREGTSPAVAFSAGGPLVAYHSSGSLFLRTVDAGASELVSCGNGVCTGPDVSAVTGDSPDLRVVDPKPGTLCAAPAHVTPCVLVVFEAFGGAAPDSDPGKFEIVTGVAIAPFADGLTATPFGEFATVSRNSAGARANQPSFRPSFDRNGEAVAWVSTATNLTNDPLPAAHPDEAYLRTLQAGSTTLLSKAAAAADDTVSNVQLGGDLAHLRATFDTRASNFPGTGDQAYVRDVPAATTTLLNRAPGAQGAAGDRFSDTPALSADGSTAVFEGGSTNLGAGRSDFLRVFARRLDSAAQPVELVSRPSGNDPFAGETHDSESFGSVVSANGRYVAFGSDSDSLSGDDDDDVENVYVRDLVSGHTVLVSRASGANGAGANEESFVAGISADGRKVAFSSEAGNLSPDAAIGTEQAYVRDLDTNTTTLTGRAAGANGLPAGNGSAAIGISADGRVALVSSNAPLDPAAGAVVHAHLFARNLVTQTTTLVDRDSGIDGTVAATSSGDGAIDADGGRVVFESEAKLADAPADGKRHIYVRDLRAGTTTLASRADGAAGASADQESRDPAIDGAGDVVAFASLGQNLGTPGTAVWRVYTRDLGDGRTEPISQPPDATKAPTFADFPSLDAAGDLVSFTARGIETSDEVYVRDRRAQTTTLVSRANGAGGAPSDGNASFSALSPAGDCVVFNAAATNLADGFASADFDAVHLRTLSDTCLVDPPATTTTAPATTTTTTTTTTTHAATPSLRGLALSPSRFHVGSAKTATTVRFSLSAAAGVTLRFDRLSSGHRKGSRCVAKGHGRACTLATAAGTMTVRGRSGANRVGFSGRLRGHALRTGRYRLTATPAQGTARTATFTVVAAPRHRGRHR